MFIRASPRTLLFLYPLSSNNYETYLPLLIRLLIINNFFHYNSIFVRLLFHPTGHHSFQYTGLPRIGGK